MTHAPNNPAGRLLHILKAGSARLGELRSKPVSLGLAELLSLDPSEPALVLKAIGDITSLPREITVAVQKLTGVDPKLLVAWIPKFMEPWRKLNLELSFETVMRPVDETMLSILAICDNMLSQQQPEPVAPADQLKSIQKDVTSLASEIAGAELPEKFKDYLLHLLATIDAAISDYRIRGFKALKTGVEQCIGAIVVYPNSRNELRSGPFGQRVLKILGVFTTLVTVLHNSLQLPQDVKQLLPDAAAQHEGVVQAETAGSRDQQREVMSRAPAS